MTLADFTRYAEQAGWLAGTVAAVLFALGAAGLGVVVGLLPRFFQVRWIVFAPIAGLAAITLIALPLSLLGLPVATYAWPLLIVLAMISAGSVALAMRSSGFLRSGRILTAYVRHGWVWPAVGFVIVVLLSARMLTYGGNGKADGSWGSTDFGAYWIVADYLQHNGGDVASYDRQARYRASDIEEHLQVHARLGGMVCIALLGQTIMPDRLPALINPLIAASLWLTVALVQVFARRERLWPATATMACVCHPFLYFLLFYTYLGQAFSVLLIAAGLLIAEVSERTSSNGSWHRGALAAGLCFAASILQYSSAFLVPGIFLAGFLVFRFRRNLLSPLLVCGVTVLVAAGYHLTRSFRELAAIRQLRIMPGWEWNRLVNVHELLGLRSLIRYDPPPEGDLAGILVTIAITSLMGLALFIYLRRGVLPRSAAAMLLSTCALAAYACFKVWQGVPNATHGLAKVVSQYAVFILIFVAAGTVAAFPRQRRKAQSLVLASLGMFALIQLLQVANWRRAPWFDYDLVALVARHENESMLLAFDSNLDDRLVAPLVKDVRRLAESSHSGPLLRFTLATEQSEYAGSVLVDREGAYVALRQK